MSKTLSRDDLLAPTSFKREAVQLRGGTVYVQQLSWRAIALMGDDQDSEGVKTSKMVTASLVDENGERLFSESDWGELSDSLTPQEFKDLMDVVRRINGFGGTEGN